VEYAAEALVQLSTYPGVKPPPGRVDDLSPRASRATMMDGGQGQWREWLLQ